MRLKGYGKEILCWPMTAMASASKHLIFGQAVEMVHGRTQSIILLKVRECKNIYLIRQAPLMLI